MKTFEELSLGKELKEALSDLKFTEPTKVQSAVIPLAMQGQDLMVCSETGTGKTAAYGIPMVSMLLEDKKKTALVLAPTRELAHQIAEFLRELTSHCKNYRVTSLVGGADMRKQVNALRKNPRIIVATPGRLNDHIRRRSVRLNSAQILVLDEGDRMLDMGFAPQLDEILKHVPKQRHSSLFTATLPDKVKKLAENYLDKPKSIDVGRASLPVAAIKQSIVQLTFHDKDDRIVDELNERQGSVIIFTRTQNRTNILARHLIGFGFKVDLIHGGRTQGQRNKAIQNFKQGKSRILCATDIAARGIDVPEVEHVINFDLPRMIEDYVHRIGRTARNGAKGEAVTFVTPEEHRTWQSLARKYKIEGVELKGVVRGKPQRKRGRPSRGGRVTGELVAKGRRGDSESRGRSRFGKSPDKRSSFNKTSKRPSKQSNDFQSENDGSRSFNKKRTRVKLSGEVFGRDSKSGTSPQRKKRFSKDSERSDFSKSRKRPSKQSRDFQSENDGSRSFNKKRTRVKLSGEVFGRDSKSGTSPQRKKRFSKDSERSDFTKSRKSPSKKSSEFQGDRSGSRPLKRKRVTKAAAGGFRGKSSKKTVSRRARG